MFSHEELRLGANYEDFDRFITAFNELEVYLSTWLTDIRDKRKSARGFLDVLGRVVPPLEKANYLFSVGMWDNEYYRDKVQYVLRNCLRWQKQIANNEN